MRVVFTETPGDCEALRAACPAAEFRPDAYHGRGPTVYVAHAPEHLEAYERWFPGVGIRARARLAHRPLGPASALYVPVSYESWVVVIDSAAGFGAAMEAAAVLKDVGTLVCPAFDTQDANVAHQLRQGMGGPFERWHDRINPGVQPNKI